MDTGIAKKTLRHELEKLRRRIRTSKCTDWAVEYKIYDPKKIAADYPVLYLTVGNEKRRRCVAETHSLASGILAVSFFRNNLRHKLAMRKIVLGLVVPGHDATHADWVLSRTNTDQITKTMTTMDEWLWLYSGGNIFIRNALNVRHPPSYGALRFPIITGVRIRILRRLR